MEWQERMNRAIDWLERHLTEEVAWEEAARNTPHGQPIVLPGR